VKHELLSRAFVVFNCRAEGSRVELHQLTCEVLAILDRSTCNIHLYFCGINVTGHNEKHAVQFAI
jgi:hypothetical protein